MAKKTDKDVQASSIGADKHDGEGLEHGHAGYQDQRDLDVRLQRATGNSREFPPQE